jgi:dTDP-4-dehydrorhamnose 3,5-epimerase
VRFVPTKFESAWLIEPDRHEDERGFFARTWCQQEFQERGLNTDLVQCNISFNRAKGTLRGMHFQAAPHEETKLVRCTQGRIFDVIVDVREDSPTYGQWEGFELSAKNRNALYIPEGFAHGFQTLEPDSEVSYQMGTSYASDGARGVNFADISVGIQWPLKPKAVSTRDQALPSLTEFKQLRAAVHVKGHSLKVGTPNRRVLVTGASGFVGRHCLKPLVERGFDVHTTGHTTQLETNERVTWHNCDLTQPDSVTSLMQAIRPTHLLHLAWVTDPRSFWTSGNNRQWMDATINLFREFYSSGGARVVGTGSCAEYHWDSEPLSETHSIERPATLYGQSKLATWHYLQTLCAEQRSSAPLSAGITQPEKPQTAAWARLFFLYGPHGHGSRMPAAVVSSLLNGELAKCSHGKQLRDFLFIQDAADAIVTLLDSTVENVVNIGSGEPTQILDIAREVADQLNARDRLRMGAIEPPPDDPKAIVAETLRLRNELGWQPAVTLKHGINQTIAWWQAQTNTRAA